MYNVSSGQTGERIRNQRTNNLIVLCTIMLELSNCKKTIKLSNHTAFDSGNTRVNNSVVYLHSNIKFLYTFSFITLFYLNHLVKEIR